jgi:hypothetical protein
MHIPACSPLPIAVIFSIIVADAAIFAVFAGIEFLLGLEELFHKCEVGIELGEVEIFGGLKYSGDQEQATVIKESGHLWLCTSKLPASSQLLFVPSIARATFNAAREVPPSWYTEIHMGRHDDRGPVA